MADKSALQPETPTTEPAPAAGNARKMSDPIALSEPIVRGDTTITEITLRKPKAGELRGMNLASLTNGDGSAVLDVLPRISIPPITQPEADNLEPEDLVVCAEAIIDFFLTAAKRKRMEQVLKA